MGGWMRPPFIYQFNHTYPLPSTHPPTHLPTYLHIRLPNENGGSRPGRCPGLPEGQAKHGPAQRLLHEPIEALRQSAGRGAKGGAGQARAAWDWRRRRRRRRSRRGWEGEVHWPGLAPALAKAKAEGGGGGGGGKEEEAAWPFPASFDSSTKQHWALPSSLFFLFSITTSKGPARAGLATKAASDWTEHASFFFLLLFFCREEEAASNKPDRPVPSPRHG